MGVCTAGVCTERARVGAAALPPWLPPSCSVVCCACTGVHARCGGTGDRGAGAMSVGLCKGKSDPRSGMICLKLKALVGWQIGEHLTASPHLTAHQRLGQVAHDSRQAPDAPRVVVEQPGLVDDHERVAALAVELCGAPVAPLRDGPQAPRSTSAAASRSRLAAMAAASSARDAACSASARDAACSASARDAACSASARDAACSRAAQ